MGTKGSELTAVAVSFLILSWLTIALRLYVRTRVKKFFGVDDILALLSLFVFTTICGLIIAGVKAGMGTHFADLSLESYSRGSKLFFLCELLYVLVTALVKVSICITLLRIAVERPQVYTLYAIIVLTTLFSIFYFFFILFLCRPTSFFWEQVLGATDGSCLPGNAITSATYAHGIFIVMVDLTLGTFPIFLVRKLKLNYRSKVSVALILAFGSIASVATIARLPNVQSLANRTDFLYANAPLGLSSAVEIGISICASSAATLRPLLIQFRIFRFSVDDANSYSREHGATDSEGVAMRSTKRSSGFGKSKSKNEGSILERSESVEAIWDGGERAGRRNGSVRVEAAESYGYQQAPSGRIQKVVEVSTTVSTPAGVYRPP